MSSSKDQYGYEFADQVVATVEAPTARVNMTYDASPAADQPIIVFDHADSQTQASQRSSAPSGG